MKFCSATKNDQNAKNGSIITGRYRRTFFADVVKPSFDDFERADVVEASYENFENLER